MVRMRYGSALGTFGEHIRSPNALQIYALQMYPMHYHSAYGPYLWSVCAMVVHWVHLESKDALRMHPNAFQCIWVHSESVYALQMYPMRYHSAYGPYLWSVCAMVAHWVHLESIDALQIHPNAPNAFGCTPNVPNTLP